MSLPAPDRAARIDLFLRSAGLQTAALRWLPGDASTRRYARLSSPTGAALMLMDAPPAAESAPCGSDADAETRRAAGYNALARLAACRVDAFVGAADWLRGLGLSAPQVWAFDVEGGLAVLEDLGDDLLARRVEAGADPQPLYAAAVDVLSRLHAAPAPDLLPVPGAPGWPLLPYDALALQTGADLFLEWWPRFCGQPGFPDAAQAQWSALWAPVQARGEAGAAVFTHRELPRGEPAVAGRASGAGAGRAAGLPGRGAGASGLGPAVPAAGLSARGRARAGAGHAGALPRRPMTPTPARPSCRTTPGWRR